MCSRDLFLAFSGDGESGMTTTRTLAQERPELADAIKKMSSVRVPAALERDNEGLLPVDGLMMGSQLDGGATGKSTISA